MSSSPNPTFADLYRPMSNLELQSLASDWHSLTDEARTALSAEFTARGLDLIEPPPPADEEPEYRELVTLRRYRDLSEAIIARGAIESAGIFCFLKDENLVRLNWQISNMIGGIRLQVAAADVEAAEAVLTQPIPNSIDFAEEILDEPNSPALRPPHPPRRPLMDLPEMRPPLGRSSRPRHRITYRTPTPSTTTGSKTFPPCSQILTSPLPIS